MNDLLLRNTWKICIEASYIEIKIISDTLNKSINLPISLAETPESENPGRMRYLQTILSYFSGILDSVEQLK